MTPKKETIARVALFLWIGASTLISADLLGGHLLTLPKPTALGLERFASEAATQPHPERWTLIHVLNAECRCSMRVFDHVLESERPDGAAETIVLIGSDPDQERRAREHGLAIELLSESELIERYEVDAVPLFIAIDPAGRVRYSGGYTDRKQGPDVRDRKIFETLQRGEDVEPLPLFGCAVSKKLKRTLDPLGLK